MFFVNLIGALLQITHMELGAAKLTVEIADTRSSQEKGLMNRDHLPQDHGMLFVYHQPEIVSFWMKDTKIPLSVGFFDEDCRLVQIENMNPPPPLTPTALLKRYLSKSPVKYALEVSQNWFQEHDIVLGDQFRLKENK